MLDAEFSVKVNMVLDKIVSDIEEQDPDGNIDIDLNDGILNLVTDKGTFVVNKQSAAKEIWLSSPISGPYHFAYNNGSWLSRDDVDLYQILRSELNIQFKKLDD